MQGYIYEHGQWWKIEVTGPFKTDGQSCFEWAESYYPPEQRVVWEKLTKQEQAEWEQIAREVEEIVNG
jgi:hypothetical protein